MPVRVVSQPHEGFRLTRLRNLAIATSTADYLVFIDGDMLLHQGFVADHRRQARPGYFTQGVRVRADGALTRRLIADPAMELSPLSRGALTIEIVGSGATQFPIAVVSFRAEEGLTQPLSRIVAADLQRSGLFRLIDAGGMNPVPHEPAQLNYEQWRARGADAVVIGSVSRLPDGRYDVRFRLMDVVKQAQLAGYVYYARADNLRLVAHKIADLIYEKLTGETGVFATRSPDRPNPIGLHRVTVLEVKEGKLRVAALEAIDGTPVVDIKPVLSANVSER